MSDKSERKGGRPSRYTNSLAAMICEAVSTNSCGIKKICEMYAHFPAINTIRLWRLQIPEFAEKYAQAKRIQADLMVEDVEDLISDLNQYKFEDEKGALRLDSGLVSHAKLLTEYRKWVASRLLPKVYGDQKQVEELQADKERLKAELDELRGKLDAKNKKEF